MVVRVGAVGFEAGSLPLASAGAFAGMVSLLSYTCRCVFIKPFCSIFPHFLNMSFRLDSFSL